MNYLYTGQFRGAAHNGRNFQLKKITDIPVIFHYLSGYDGHIIFQNITKLEGMKEPQVVIKTMEKLVTFSIGNLKFKDSLQFLNSSIEKLVKTLSAKSNLFNHLKEYFQIFQRKLSIC